MELSSMLGRNLAVLKVNDVIIYGSQGVCKIVDITEKSMTGAKKKYYVLKPVADQGATIYAPTDNAHVLKKMRRLLSEAEINQLIDSMPAETGIWVKNDNDRKEIYKQILAGGNHVELIKMIKAIYAHKKERETEGKRLHMVDGHFFKDAEQILYNEFQYVLHLNSKDELMQYIVNRLK